MSSSPGARLPLSRFARLHTLDVDEARQVVAEAFCPHQLTVRDGARGFDTRFHSASTGAVSLSYLDYGGDVLIKPYEQETFYLVLMPLAGRAELSHGREHAQYDRDGAAVPPVDRRYTITVSAGSPHLVMWIARNRLEEHLRTMLAHPLTEPVRFGLGMDMTAPDVRSWRRVVALLLAEAEDDGPVLSRPAASRALEELLLNGLLMAQPNNYSAELHAPPRGTAPKTVRRAVALIQTATADQLTVLDIAKAAGVSIRSLQQDFHRYLNTTPTRYLREIRLQHARERLVAADPADTTVTEIATDCGFLHIGRFSTQYRERFGEPPSTTLRQ